MNKNGNQGFIIPLSSFCTQRMKPLVQFYKKRKCTSWVSHYGWRPATLFEGVNIPLSIIITNSTYEKKGADLYVTEFYKWYQEKRSSLTNLIDYNLANDLLIHDFVFPKIGSQYNSIFKKMFAIKSSLGKYIGKTNNYDAPHC